MVEELHGKLIRLLSDILLILGCLLFMISMAEPFLAAYYIMGCASIQEYPTPRGCQWLPTYYWSFKAIRSFTIETAQFGSYWFGSFAEMPDRTQTPILLIIAFLGQMLTVASGLLSLVIRKGWIRMIPLASSGTVLLLMNHIHDGFAYYGYKVDYQLGYWDLFPSILVFLLAFSICLPSIMLSLLKWMVSKKLITPKRKTTDK